MIDSTKFRSARCAALYFSAALACASLLVPSVGSAAGGDDTSLPMNAAPLPPDAPATATAPATPQKGGKNKKTGKGTDSTAATPAAPADGDSSASAAPASPSVPGTLVGEWATKDSKGPDGVFSFCYSEAKFSNNLGLVVARNAAGESNLALIVPGGKLPQGQMIPIKVRIDQGNNREPRSVAAQPDRLIMALGKDDAFVDALKKGKQLIIEAPGDKATFVMSKAGKALSELKSCVDKAVSGDPDAAARSTLPEGLRGLLSTAGFQHYRVIDLSKVDEDKRPGNFMWQIGPVVGGVREVRVDEKTDLATVVGKYSDVLKTQCKGDFNFEKGTEDKFPAVTVQNASLSCAMPDHKVYASLLFYLTTKGKLFSVFFHQGEDKDKADADKARDAIGKVIRDAAQKTPAEAPGAAPAATPAPAKAGK